MATRSYTSRRELEQYRFSAGTTLLVPLVLLFVQAELPRLFPHLLLPDLPLLAVLFFAVGRRNPIVGTLTGAVIGLVQDALTGQPIGIFGIAKSLIGYAASSIGVQVDVENVVTRTLMNLGFSLAQSALLYLINRILLGVAGYRLLWLHELERAGLNAAIALPLFALLDRLKRRD